MITIREIAAIAGVSRSTVSLVLNNSPLVKDETREHVLQVIRETGYVPNANARNLSQRVNKSLGIIILSEQKRTSSYGFDRSLGLYSLDVMRGITAHLADTPYSVIIEYFAIPGHECTADDLPASHNPLLPKLIRERKVDGAFVVCGYCTEQFLAAMNESGIPFVTIASGMPESICDSVYSDTAEGVYNALMTLFARGRTRPALITCPAFRSAPLRIEGFKRACRDGGIPFDPGMIIDGKHNTGESAYQAMQQVLASSVFPDALVGANPQVTVGAMHCLLDSGVRVPEDVSIIACEDNSLCGYTRPMITAVNIQKESMGESAVELLLRRIQTPDAPVTSVRISSYMVHRKSV